MPPQTPPFETRLGRYVTTVAFNETVQAYVPPPLPPSPPLDFSHRLLGVLSQADADRLPALVKAGLIHVQFETIHPFLDGNGRLGRLLVALFLVDRGVLREPLLYLSLYLKVHRADYYRLLQEVRQRGAWEAWLEFFLQGVAETANNAYESAIRIATLFRTDRERIASAPEGSSSMLRLHEVLQTHPFLNATQAASRTGLSVPTVNTALAGLEALGVVREITGKQRGRVFSYDAFLQILDEGTSVPPVDDIDGRNG